MLNTLREQPQEILTEYLTEGWFGEQSRICPWLFYLLLNVEQSVLTKLEKSKSWHIVTEKGNTVHLLEVALLLAAMWSTFIYPFRYKYIDLVCIYDC